MKIISIEEFDRICEDPEIEEVHYNGVSGLNSEYLWHTVFTVEGEEYDIYVNRNEF